MPDFWRSLPFWGGNVHNPSYNLAVGVLYLFCVFFNNLYINPTHLSLLFFLQTSDFNIGRDMYAKR